MSKTLTKTPPKTPHADYDTRRDAITATAASLFAQKGFAAASVADLAQACGTSKALIYHYFPAKEDILFEVIDSHMQALAEAAFRATLAPTAPETNAPTAPETKLRLFARELMALQAGAPAQHQISVYDLKHLPENRRAPIIDTQRRIIALFDRLLTTLRPAWRGHAQRDLLTKMFFGLLNGPTMWFDPATADTVADLAVNMFLAALPP